MWSGHETPYQVHLSPNTYTQNVTTQQEAIKLQQQRDKAHDNETEEATTPFQRKYYMEINWMKNSVSQHLRAKKARLYTNLSRRKIWSPVKWIHPNQFYPQSNNAHVLWMNFRTCHWVERSCDTPQQNYSCFYRSWRPAFIQTSVTGIWMTAG